MARELALAAVERHGYAVLGEPSKLRAVVRFHPGPLTDVAAGPTVGNVETVAFNEMRRTHIESGVSKSRGADGQPEDRPVADSWLTTPWPDIEPAMAYQLGLPILIFRERGVIADGVLELGVVGVYMPEVDLTQDMDGFFSSPEWTQPIGRWEGRVRRVIERKGQPPELY